MIPNGDAVESTIQLSFNFKELQDMLFVLEDARQSEDKHLSRAASKVHEMLREKFFGD